MEAPVTDDCVEWRGRRMSTGYGVFTAPGNPRPVLAHRDAWEKANGVAIPAGMVVCHSCDNPPCVNPAHLFIGTQLDNMRDMVAKGRSGTNGFERKVQCPSGHPYDESNTYLHPAGYRSCRECQRIACRKYDAKRRQSNSQKEA